MVIKGLYSNYKFYIVNTCPLFTFKGNYKYYKVIISTTK